MSSSRRARRIRRHRKYGKPSYPSLPKNGLTHSSIVTAVGVSPYLDEKRPRVITSETIDWGRSYISCDTMMPTFKKEERTRNFRTKYFLD